MAQVRRLECLHEFPQDKLLPTEGFIFQVDLLVVILIRVNNGVWHYHQRPNPHLNPQLVDPSLGLDFIVVGRRGKFQ